MNSAKKRVLTRQKKKISIRKKINGTGDRPRVTVFKSSNHIYVQAIDDLKQVTIQSMSTSLGEIKKAIKGHTGNINAAKIVGEHFGKKLKESGIENVVFDRNGFIYHGRLKSLADGMRESGLKF